MKCGQKQVLDDRQIGSHPQVRFRCAKCGAMVDVDVTQDTNRTTVSFYRAETPLIEPTVISEQVGLALPAGQVVALTVLDGVARGMVFPLDRPRVVLGRAGADVVLDDPEISRWHCVLEVRGEAISVRDLDSRNGTYVNSARVESAQLQHLSEFQVGSTRLRLTVTPK